MSSAWSLRGVQVAQALGVDRAVLVGVDDGFLESRWLGAVLGGDAAADVQRDRRKLVLRQRRRLHTAVDRQDQVPRFNHGRLFAAGGHRGHGERDRGAQGDDQSQTFAHVLCLSFFGLPVSSRGQSESFGYPSTGQNTSIRY